MSAGRNSQPHVMIEARVWELHAGQGVHIPCTAPHWATTLDTPSVALQYQLRPQVDNSPGRYLSGKRLRCVDMVLAAHVNPGQRLARRLQGCRGETYFACWRSGHASTLRARRGAPGRSLPAGRVDGTGGPRSPLLPYCSRTPHCLDVIAIPDRTQKQRNIRGE